MVVSAGLALLPSMEASFVRDWRWAGTITPVELLRLCRTRQRNAGDGDKFPLRSRFMASA
jgi:hypothetical protein